MQEKEKDEIKEEENENFSNGDTLTPNSDNVDENKAEDNNDEADMAIPSDSADTSDSMVSSEADEVAEPEPEPENLEPAEKNTPETGAEKMLSQSQVNKLIGEARREGREAAMRELREKFGVADDNEMYDVFGKGQAYDDLDYEYGMQGNSYKDVLAENALLKSNISPERWEDVKLILNGKGLEVSAETIEQLLPTHPEWRSSAAAVEENSVIGPDNIVDVETAEEASKRIGAGTVKNEPPATLRKLGNEPSPVTQEDDEARVKRLFGIR